MENEIKQCPKCGSVGYLKAKANGNLAVLCGNPLCKLHKAPKSRFKQSQRMAIDDWNRRCNNGT